MGRIRTIKPEFFLHEGLAQLEPRTQLLFIGLWTLADREGRLDDRPARIKAQILPYTDCDVDSMLASLTDHPEKFLTRYESDGQKYIQINEFKAHQRPNIREPESEIPAPPESSARARTCVKVPARVEGKGNRKGMEGNGVGARAQQDHQRVIDRFLQINKVDQADQKQVTAMYQRHSRSALALIREAGNVEVALLALEWMAVTFDKKGLTWTLDTVAKHLPGFFKTGKRDLVAARFQMTPNQAEQLEKVAQWAGRAPQEAP